jgi:hypothetical protein
MLPMHQYPLASLVAVVASLQLLKKEEIYNRLASQNDEPACVGPGFMLRLG